MTAPGPLVRARDLSAGYGREAALGAVSFDLEPLRVSAVLGPGGGGKSTLLRILAGEASGHPELWVRGGLDLPAGPGRRLAQKPEPEPRSLAALIPGERLAEVWSAAPEAASVLHAVRDVPLRELSFELRRLAGLTLVLADSAPFLLLDEPEAGLEAGQQAWISAQLRALRGSRTVLLATHHLGFAREVADFALLLVRGEILEAAEVPRFFDDPVHPRARHYVRMGG